MSEKQYQWIKPDGTWRIGANIDEVMAVAKKQIDSGLKPYSLRKDGDVIRRGLRAWVLKGLRRNLETSDPGSTFRVWAKGGIEFTARVVESAVQIIDTNGNDKADKAWSLSRDEFPDIKFLGAYVCKRIAETNSYSQHSYGNAVDFGRSTMAELWELARWQVARADELSLSHVIVDDQIWSPGSGWSHYGGNRHYHVHDDFSPNLSGGCGVRG